MEDSGMADKHDVDWNAEDTYWRTNYSSRPYASGGANAYEHYQPGYRFGVESASRYQGRNWDEAETDLKRDWDSYQYRGQSTWDQMKAAVRDAWDRVTGKTHVGAR
jgi:hypothetical protein